jgi:hypothetical protein
MTADMSLFDSITNAPKALPSYLAEVAETIRNDALVAAREKLSLSRPHTDIERLFRHPGFFDYFKYELAVRVADVLGALDEPLQAVYLYDPFTDADGGIDHSMPPDATVHLLALVRAHTGTLGTWTTGLDDALTNSLRDLPAPTLARRVSVLDVMQISEEEARYCPHRRRLLSSVFAPPISIWQREE